MTAVTFWHNTAVPQCLLSLSAYPYLNFRSYSFHCSSAVSRLWWHFTAGMMGRRGRRKRLLEFVCECGGVYECVCIPLTVDWLSSLMKFRPVSCNYQDDSFLIVYSLTFLNCSNFMNCDTKKVHSSQGGQRGQLAWQSTECNWGLVCHHLHPNSLRFGHTICPNQSQPQHHKLSAN